MQYTENYFQEKNLKISLEKNDVLNIFAQNMDCGYTLTRTHDLCFEAKIKKIGIPLHAPVLVYKSGVQGGIYFMDMLS